MPAKLEASLVQDLNGEDLESRLEHKTAHELKSGDWVIEQKSGHPGSVSDIKTSKTGKHGHMKVNFICSMPFIDKKVNLMHAGNDRLSSPRMDRLTLTLASYSNNEMILLNDTGEERFVVLNEETEIGEKVKKMCDDEENVQVTLLVGPTKRGSKKAELWELVESAKAVSL